MIYDTVGHKKGLNFFEIFQICCAAGHENFENNFGVIFSISFHVLMRWPNLNRDMKYELIWSIDDELGKDFLPFSLIP